MNAISKNSEIQSLRGLAAISVFLSHSLSLMFGKGPVIFGQNLFFRAAVWSVAFFFFISGYYCFQKLENFNIKNSFKYIGKRIIRIYPVYIITILLGFFLCNLQLRWNPDYFIGNNSVWSRTINIKELIPQFVLLKWFDTELINPPVWTMIVEVKMIFVMIIIVPIIKFLSKYTKFLIIPIILLAIIAGSYIGYLRYLVMFVVGALYFCYKDRFNYDKIITKILFCLLIIYPWISSYFLKYLGKFGKETDSFLVSSIFAVLICIIFNLKDKSIIRKLLFCKFLVYIGNLSYEFYLVHFIILMALRPTMKYINNVYLYTLIAFAFSLCLAVSLHYLLDTLVKKYVKRPILIIAK